MSDDDDDVGFRLPRPEPAESFGIAAGHLTTALPKLHSNEPSDTWAHALLAGFAVESMLKSYLSSCGVSVEDLKSPKQFGHDLERLWHAAADYGMPSDGGLPDWISQLNRLHGAPFDLRYFPDKHVMVLPRASTLHGRIMELSRALGEAREGSD